MFRRRRGSQVGVGQQRVDDLPFLCPPICGRLRYRQSIGQSNLPIGGLVAPLRTSPPALTPSMPCSRKDASTSVLGAPGMQSTSPGPLPASELTGAFLSFNVMRFINAMDCATLRCRLAVILSGTRWQRCFAFLFGSVAGSISPSRQ